MKVNGPMRDMGARTEGLSDIHKAQIAIQNGKKSRALRAANLRGTASKRARRIEARLGGRCNTLPKSHINKG